MFRVKFSLLFGHDEWQTKLVSCQHVVERYPFLSVERLPSLNVGDIDEFDQEDVVKLSLRRLGYARVVDCSLVWGKSETPVEIITDLYSLLACLPAVALKLERQQAGDVVIFDATGPSRLHFIFEEGAFVCEDRDWGRNTRLRRKQTEKNHQGLLKNFAEVVGLFSTCVRRLCPELYELEAFQMWIRIWPGALEKIHELENLSNFAMQTGENG